MKKIHIGRAAAMLTALTLAAGSASITAEAEDGIKVVALGDSITTGYSSDGTLIASYAEIVSSYYGAELVNYAQDGFTSTDLVNQLSDDAVQADIASADVVLVTIGGNDILHLVLNNEYLDATQYSTMYELIAAMKTESGAPDWTVLLPLQQYLNNAMPAAISQYRSNVALIAEQLKSLTDGRIVFQTVYNPMDCDADDTPLASSGSMEILTTNVTGYLEGKQDNTVFPLGQCVNGAIRDLQDVIVVDTYQTFLDHGVYYTNINDVDVHPNNRGHLVIAESVIQALDIAETGSENGALMRKVYTSTDAESTLSSVAAELNDSIMVRAMKNAYGDVNADTKVDLDDASGTLSIYAAVGAGAESPITGLNAQAADGNQNGTVGLDDATLMLSYYAEFSSMLFSGTFMEYAAQVK